MTSTWSRPPGTVSRGVISASPISPCAESQPVENARHLRPLALPVARRSRSPAGYHGPAMGTEAVRFLVLLMAGWVNSRQLEVIHFLQEENRVLREQLGGRRLRFTDDQRRRLAVKGRIVVVAGSANSRAWSHPTRSCAGTAS
jgi:hypothetical protein